MALQSQTNHFLSTEILCLVLCFLFQCSYTTRRNMWDEISVVCLGAFPGIIMFNQLKQREEARLELTTTFFFVWNCVTRGFRTEVKGWGRVDWRQQMWNDAQVSCGEALYLVQNGKWARSFWLLVSRRTETWVLHGEGATGIRCNQANDLETLIQSLWKQSGYMWRQCQDTGSASGGKQSHFSTRLKKTEKYSRC